MPGALQAGRLASEGRGPEAAPGAASSSVFYHAEGETELPESGALFDDAEGEDEEEGEQPPEPLEDAHPGGSPEAAAGPRLLGQRKRTLPRAGSGLMRILGLWLRPEPAPAAEDECRRRARHLAEGAPGAPGPADDVALPPAALAPRLAGIDSPTERAAEKGGLVGSFEKRSPWWVEGWRPRTYRLCDRKLLYFRKDRPDRPQGVLDFSLVRFELHCCWQHPGGGKAGAQDDFERPRSCNICDVPVLGDTKTFYLKPVAFSSKVFAFRGPADEMEALTARIAQLVAAPMLSALKNERMVLSLKNFWRYPFIREHEFKKQAESVDILLFRGKDGAAKLQRAATGADYDHVALIMKSVTQEVFILEATGVHGVKIISWDYFTGRGWHKCYAWMAVRKVYFQRTPEQLQALQTYVASVLGRPYGLSLGKLVGKTTSVAYNEQGRPLEAPEGQEGGHETLFCSELAAACLKRCGVLASARASSRYWPSSFSQHCPEPLPLQEHAHVGEEQLIVFGA